MSILSGIPVRMSREVWGPLVWRLLHCLADMSDRNDIYMIWNNVLRTTAVMMPCEMCRMHMIEYWAHVRFLPKQWHDIKGDIVRTQIREKIHAFHNAVNARLGKPLPSLEAPRERSLCRTEAQECFKRLCELWMGKEALMEWKMAIQSLMNMVFAGPT